MPNWTTNDVVIHCDNEETIKKVVKFLESKSKIPANKREFDFENLFSAPKELLDLESLENQLCAAPVESLKEAIKKKIELLKKDLKQEYGFDSMHSFHCEKWGTKWNSCDIYRGPIQKIGNLWSVRYQFMTAWAPPMPIYEELSRLFKAVTISVDCSDEGSCYNPFHATFIGGVKTEEFEVDEVEEDEIGF